MRIRSIHELSVPVSRYADPAIAPGGLTTSLVAVTTDAMREGEPVVGYGYSSVGRFAQGGLIRERLAPRLLSAAEDSLIDLGGINLDPFRAWDVMMTGEKPGGHGERCVAVGALDMLGADVRHLGQAIAPLREARERGGCDLREGSQAQLARSAHGQVPE